MSKTIDIPEAKSLRWLVFNFPLTIPAKDDGDRLCNSIHAYADAGARKIQDYAERIAEAMPLIESAIDTLTEAGNGATVKDLHEAADRLFRVRGILSGEAKLDEQAE